MPRVRYEVMIALADADVTIMVYVSAEIGTSKGELIKKAREACLVAGLNINLRSTFDYVVED